MLGLIGFVATVFAAAYHFYLLLYEAYATVALARDPATQALVGDGPLAHGAGALGSFGFASILAFPLFGVATVRAGILPRWAGWLQIASVSVFFLSIFIISPDAPAPLPGVAPITLLYYLTFLGYAWGGYALWKEEETVQEPGAEAKAPQPLV